MIIRQQFGRSRKFRLENRRIGARKRFDEMQIGTVINNKDWIPWVEFSHLLVTHDPQVDRFQTLDASQYDESNEFFFFFFLLRLWFVWRFIWFDRVMIN